MTSKDFTAIPNTTANEIQENITAHSILVTTMIIHYTRNYLKEFHSIQKIREIAKNLKFHRTFGMLVLHLIQCPDLTFEELNNLMTCGKYQLPKYFIKTFHLEIQNVVSKDVDGIIDMFKSIEGNLLDSGLPKVHPLRIINGSSPIGIFLRRGVVFFDKMLFIQIEAIINELKSSSITILNKLPVSDNKKKSSYIYKCIFFKYSVFF